MKQIKIKKKASGLEKHIILKIIKKINKASKIIRIPLNYLQK